MAKYRVVVTDLGYASYQPEAVVLAEVGAELEARDCRTEDEIIDLARDADGVIVRMAPVTRRVIENLSRCVVISRYGVGCDNVDVRAATEHGIMVANVPDYCLEDVSDHALALLLSAVRKIPSHDKRVRAGDWDIGARDPVWRTKGKTLGLLGFGNIARTLARKVGGLELRIITHDPYVDPDTAAAAGAELVDFETLLTRSDYLSIHAPLNDGTRHIIDAPALAKMKPNAILVNTSRGGLIDTDALVEALRAGRIGVAALDVYEEEPPPKQSPLFALESAIVTDHAPGLDERHQQIGAQ